MERFLDFLAESKEGKNLHLTHLQDRILEDGVAGARDSINFLQSLRDMLAGTSTTNKVKLTTKWDGAPAIFAGINPENGKFFVGTKGVFAQNAKLNYTDKDIDANHPSEGLSKKLKIALRYLPDLGITGVLQGDMMFTHDDLKIKEIDGEKLYTFQPNTIVYAVPVNSGLGDQIYKAKLGVVWHTTYTGRKLSDMKASFGVDIGRLKHTRDVWYRDASFVDATGAATFNRQDTQELTNLLSQAGSIFQKMNPGFLNQLAGSETYRIQIMTWNNSKVREGQEIKDTSAHTKNFLINLEEKYNKYILEAKQEETRRKRTTEKNMVINFYKKNLVDLKRIFDFQNIITDAKNMIVKKLQQVKDIHTFMNTDDGFKVTAPEGFVAISIENGNAVKLIDQLVFSKANFETTKTWQK